MDDTLGPVQVHDRKDGVLAITAVCGVCSLAMVVEISNVPAFTRQVVLSVLGTVKRATTREGVSVIQYSATCWKCIEDAAAIEE